MWRLLLYYIMNRSTKGRHKITNSWRLIEKLQFSVHYYCFFWDIQRPFLVDEGEFGIRVILSCYKV